MAEQFCPHCGTEVDVDARFCPTCGQTLIDEAAVADWSEEAEGANGGDEQPPVEAASPIPPAPAWPPAEPTEPREPVPPAEAGEPVPRVVPEAAGTTRAPAPPDAPPPPAAQQPGAGRDRDSDLPFTVPTMLSGWLIGAGSGVSALALLPNLGSILNVLIFVALLWVTATVFLADRLPPFAHQRLATLTVVMVAVGAALDRAAFTVRGIDTVFLITALAAAGGVLLLELGRDRPMPPVDGAA